MRTLVTGASGFIGGHVVEALIRQGHEVRALVRPTSDTSHLAGTGAELVVGDVTDAASLLKATERVDWVLHTAAVVGSHGPWSHYRDVGVRGTANMLNAAFRSGVHRFIHVSSIAVYGAHHHPVPLTEDEPFDGRIQRWNHYVREKVLSERLVWRAHERGNVVATAIRPSVVIGPRDRAVVPRLLGVLGTPLAGIVGAGDNHVPVVVVEELAAAIVRAAEREQAAGRAYNLSSRDEFTQQELVRMFAELAERPVPGRHVPFKAAMVMASALEAGYRLGRRRTGPPMDRIGIAVLGLESRIDCSRARADLDWEGTGDIADAARRSLDHHFGRA